MDKIILNQEQIFQLVKENYFPTSFEDIRCRCIEGRYDNNLKNQKGRLEINQNKKIFPALTIPGGDLGQLAIILATANNFGLKINKDKLLTAYEEFLGGWQNFYFHSDNHHSPSSLAAGCSYYQLIKENSEKFYLQPQDIDFIDNQITIINQKANQQMVYGEHNEGAVILLKGEIGIYPQYVFTVTSQAETKKINASVFVFNYTLFNHRQYFLAKKLINREVVQLFSGLDEEYLTFTLIETAEIHLFETMTHLAKNLPLYQVVFDKNFKFKVKPLDKIHQQQ